MWAAVALALTLLEAIDTPGLSWRRRLADAPWFVVYLVVSPLVGLAADSVVSALDRPNPIGDLPLAVQVPIALVVYDLVSYALHRLMHATAWGWHLHRIHHSSTHVSWWTAFRAHPLSALALHVAPVATLSALGLNGQTITIAVSVVLVVTLIGHADIWLPRPLDHVLATPRYHRRHHEREHADRNLALLFPALDTVFGTRITSTARPRSPRTLHSPRRSSTDSATTQLGAFD